MHRQVLIACWPYALAMVACLVALRVLAGLLGPRVHIARLAGLHRDQSGAVQSLSFVLTLPVFMMILLFLVQVSQLAIARVVLEYAAFAAARSAIVWIPAHLGPGEEENRISHLRYLGEVRDEDGTRFSEYLVEPEGPKYRKIHFAAAMACLPICPSRDVGESRAHPGNAAAHALIRAYHAYAPGAAANRRIPWRIRHKLAYALNRTRVRILVRHKAEEPALMRYGEPPYPEEFTSNEIGWQDQIVVTVEHDFLLLPGAGRLLSRSPTLETSAGGAAERTAPRSNLFLYPMRATVRLGNEGEKPVLPYIQHVYGGQPPHPYEDDRDDDSYKYHQDDLHGYLGDEDDDFGGNGAREP